ncbi:hypothetical protein ACN38_g5055 [Penicillium nordicum]|uniref:Uncharacterized protein n=1 Tax=Penicillium nordicum TaxID=229535 RepID=A0A0M8P5K0_9EURO|nr:hypothetical protein ACN38_g5055 [Penicillium nordicum]
MTCLLTWSWAALSLLVFCFLLLPFPQKKLGEFAMIWHRAGALIEHLACAVNFLLDDLAYMYLHPASAGHCMFFYFIYSLQYIHLIMIP